MTEVNANGMGISPRIATEALILAMRDGSEVVEWTVSLVQKYAIVSSRYSMTVSVSNQAKSMRPIPAEPTYSMFTLAGLPVAVIWDAPDDTIIGKNKDGAEVVKITSLKVPTI